MPSVPLAEGAPGTVAPWCDAASVEKDERLEDIELPDGITIGMCVQAASEELFKFSGARWPGLRTDTVRPHRINDDGSDMAGIAWGFGGWGWTGTGGLWSRLFPEGWGAGVLNSNEIMLPGPVTSIVSVTVDGVVLDPSTYALYDNRRLVRLQDPTTGTVLGWPSTQRLALPLTEVNTWGITFQHGRQPPMAGYLAAREWSIQKALWVASNKKRLPQRSQKVVRQGVDITIEQGSMLNDGKVGIALVDTFLEAYNPQRLHRKARVYSPDSITPAISQTSQP